MVTIWSFSLLTANSVSVCRQDEQTAGEVDDDGQDRVAERLASGRGPQRHTQTGAGSEERLEGVEETSQEHLLLLQADLESEEELKPHVPQLPQNLLLPHRLSYPSSCSVVIISNLHYITSLMPQCAKAESVICTITIILLFITIVENKT